MIIKIRPLTFILKSRRDRKKSPDHKSWSNIEKTKLDQKSPRHLKSDPLIFEVVTLILILKSRHLKVCKIKKAHQQKSKNPHF